MAFHLIGYTESQDSATLVNVAALADPILRIVGDDVTVHRDITNIVCVAAIGPNVTRAQLVAPSLRRIFNYEIQPIDVAAFPSSPPAYVDLRRQPIVLDADEQLNAQAAEDAAGASRATVLVWLADGPISPVEGEVRTIRVTNASTLTANAWTNGALTFAETLPAGRYAVVGARFRSTNMQAFRLVFVGGIWRPGALGAQAVSDLDAPLFRAGGFGVWGEFDHNTPPTVDFLANGADSAQTGELDLIKIG